MVLLGLRATVRRLGSSRSGAVVHYMFIC